MKLDIDFNQNLISKKELADKLRLVLFLSMNKLQEAAIRRAPVDTGRLRTSIHLTPATPGFDEYILSDGVDYGIHLEYGTSPHYVPISPLKGWSRRVLGDEAISYAIRAAIAKRGTPAQPFFRPALVEVKRINFGKIWNKVMAKP